MSNIRWTWNITFRLIEGREEGVVSKKQSNKAKGPDKRMRKEVEMRFAQLECRVGLGGRDWFSMNLNIKLKCLYLT